MAAFAPRSNAALRIEEEVVATVTAILATAGHPDAIVLPRTVRILNKDILECIWHDGTGCYTSEICCSAKKVLNTEAGMPA